MPIQNIAKHLNDYPSLLTFSIIDIFVAAVQLSLPKSYLLQVG